MRTATDNSPSLADLGRALVSAAQAKIDQKEGTILGLRRENERLSQAVSELRKGQQNSVHPKCVGCIHRLVAMRTLDAQDKKEE